MQIWRSIGWFEAIMSSLIALFGAVCVVGGYLSFQQHQGILESRVKAVKILSLQGNLVRVQAVNTTDEEAAYFVVPLADASDANELDVLSEYAVVLYRGKEARLCPKGSHDSWACQDIAQVQAPELVEWVRHAPTNREMLSSLAQHRP